MPDLSPKQIATYPTSFLKTRLGVLRNSSATRSGLQGVLIEAELARRSH